MIKNHLSQSLTLHKSWQKLQDSLSVGFEAYDFGVISETSYNWKWMQHIRAIQLVLVPQLYGHLTFENGEDDLYKMSFCRNFRFKCQHIQRDIIFIVDLCNSITDFINRFHQYTV